jgi:hypothetical protein
MPMEKDTSDYRTVYEKARDGVYKTKLPYPDRPTEPALLRKKAGELTLDEIASLAGVIADHETAKLNYTRAKQAYYSDVARLEQQLRADLEVEHGTVGHAKADKLWSRAWDDGHDSGLAEVALIYDRLAELVV